MPKRLLAYLAAIALSLVAPCYAQWQEVTVDTQTPHEGKKIEAFEGNQLYLRVAFLENEQPDSLSNKWSQSFWYSRDQNTSLGTQISGTWASSNICEFLGETNTLFRAGNYYWSVEGIHLSGYVKTFGRGTMQQDYNPGSDTNLQELIAEINIDWFTNNVGAQVSTNQDDIALLQAGIGTNDTTLVFLQAQITTNADNIVFLQAQITSNDVDIAALDTRVTSNEVNIASNALTAGADISITELASNNIISLTTSAQAGLVLATNAVQDNDTGLTLGGDFTSTGTLDSFEGLTLLQGVAESLGIGWDNDPNAPRKADIFDAIDMSGVIANFNSNNFASTKYVEDAITERGTSPDLSTFGPSWRTNSNAAAQTNIYEAVLTNGVIANSSETNFASTKYVEDAIEARGGDTLTAATTNYLWTAGRTWYCPTSSNINDVIDAATAGDTIQLGSGTYTVTEQIDVDKSLCIKGAGRGRTILANSATAVTIAVTADDVTLHDFTLASTYASGVAVLDIRQVSSGTIDGIVVYNLEVTHVGAAGGTGIRMWNVSADLVNIRVDVEESGGSGSALGIQAINNGDADAATYVTIHSSWVRILSTGSAECWALSIEDSTASQTIQCDVYGSYFQGNSTAGAAVRTRRPDTNLNMFNCVLDGTDVDAEEDDAPLDLFQCTLVNNTFNGTPQFLGSQHGPLDPFDSGWDGSQVVVVQDDIYDQFSGATDITNTLTGAQTNYEWTVGNVWFVPLEGDLQIAINAAADGDTIQLASGTYVIDGSITITNQIHLRGMGQGATLLDSDSDTLRIRTNNVVISDLSITNASAGEDGILIGHISTTLSGIIVRNVTINSRSTTGANMVYIKDADVLLDKVRIVGTTTDAGGAVNGILAWVTAAATHSTTQTIVDCSVELTAKAGTTTLTAIKFEEVSSTYANVAHIYYTSMFVTGDHIAYGLSSINDSAVTVYQCDIKGSAGSTDAIVGGGGVITNYGSIFRRAFPHDTVHAGANYGATNKYTGSGTRKWDGSFRHAAEGDVFDEMEKKLDSDGDGSALTGTVVQNDQENVFTEVQFGVDGTSTNSLATRGFVQEEIAKLVSVDLFQTVSQHGAFTNDLGLSLTTVSAWSSNYVLSAGVNLIDTWWTTNLVQFLPAGPATLHEHASYSGAGNPVVQLYWEWVYGATTTNVAVTSETQTISTVEGSYDIHAHNNVQIDFTNNYVGMTLYAIRTGGASATLTILGGGAKNSALLTPSLTVGSTEKDPKSIHKDGSVTWTGVDNHGTKAITNVEDEVYGAAWDGVTEVPTKNALYDKIETLGGGGGGSTITNYVEVRRVTDQNITANTVTTIVFDSEISDADGIHNAGTFIFSGIGHCILNTTAYANDGGDDEDYWLVLYRNDSSFMDSQRGKAGGSGPVSMAGTFVFFNDNATNEYEITVKSDDTTYTLEGSPNANTYATGWRFE